jgi:hypothetical protein
MGNTFHENNAWYIKTLDRDSYTLNFFKAICTYIVQTIIHVGYMFIMYFNSISEDDSLFKIAETKAMGVFMFLLILA